MKNVISSIVLLYSFCTFSKDIVLKDFNEINNSMSSITNVSTLNPNIIDSFALYFLKFPKLGTVNEYSEEAILSIYNFGFKYCTEAFENEIKLPLKSRWFYEGLPIETSAKALSEEELKLIVTSIGSQIYSEGLSAEDLIFGIEVARELIDSGHNTKRLLSNICSAFFATPKFLHKGI